MKRASYNVIGGPAVTADQLARIVELARLPHVDMGIIPPRRTNCRSPATSAVSERSDGRTGMRNQHREAVEMIPPRETTMRNTEPARKRPGPHPRLSATRLTCRRCTARIRAAAAPSPAALP
ncbi:Scr1 family TA system antitoxin-like transcriptional regulator [Nocardia abscessus]|uniref:Scr1 family TA system antitoxin-like transcriptional regulator n=1 Tax=Nocardia abscessus TaxID=120957 RepID=UPI003CC7DAB9